MSDTFYAMETWLINDDNNDLYKLPLTFKRSLDLISLDILENSICFATNNPVEAYELPLSARHSKNQNILAPEGTYTVQCNVYEIQTDYDQLYAYIYTSMMNWGQEWSMAMIAKQQGRFNLDEPVAILKANNIKIARGDDDNEEE